MTHAELDQIAARPEWEWTHGAFTTAHGTLLSKAERDALLTLAREGLAAREKQATDAAYLESVRARMRALTTATPPTIGPDGTP